MTEKKETSKVFFVIMVILIVLVVSGILFLLFYHKGEPQPPKNIQECKLKAWVGCGLPTIGNQSDWCYQIEGANSTTYSDCPFITQEVADCWTNASTNCFYNFVVIPDLINKSNSTNNS